MNWSWRIAEVSSWRIAEVSSWRIAERDDRGESVEGWSWQWVALLKVKVQHWSMRIGK
jgi:hypothetical protein